MTGDGNYGPVVPWMLKVQPAKPSIIKHTSVPQPWPTAPCENDCGPKCLTGSYLYIDIGHTSIGTLDVWEVQSMCLQEGFSDASPKWSHVCSMYEPCMSHVDVETLLPHPVGVCTFDTG